MNIFPSCNNFAFHQTANDMNTEFKRQSWELPSEDRVAELLGLTRDEYTQLSHSGIRQISGLDGQPVSYYTTISPLNPDSILGKLRPKMNKMRMVYFSPDAFPARDVPMDEAV